MREQSTERVGEKAKKRESTSDLSQKAESTTEQYRSVCRCCKTALILSLAHSRDPLISLPRSLARSTAESLENPSEPGVNRVPLLFHENSYQGPIKLSVFERLHLNSARSAIGAHGWSRERGYLVSIVGDDFRNYRRLRANVEVNATFTTLFDLFSEETVWYWYTFCLVCIFSGATVFERSSVHHWLFLLIRDVRGNAMLYLLSIDFSVSFMSPSKCGVRHRHGRSLPLLLSFITIKLLRHYKSWRVSN